MVLRIYQQQNQQPPLPDSFGIQGGGSQGAIGAPGDQGYQGDQGLIGSQIGTINFQSLGRPEICHIDQQDII